MTMLAKLLEEVAGISPHILDDKTLARAVRERMSACNLVDERQYLERARSSSRELESLIEMVVVSETSFFRDEGPFNFLSRYIREEWIPAARTKLLRILSAPCSSGEEPYSVAVVLYESGLEPEQYEIDALDISRALLRRAERAAYTQHSFRGVPESLRTRYFTQAGREYVLNDTIRQIVHFLHGNLLDESVLAARRPYDVVFCRNLMIYLGGEARKRLVSNLERLLASGGLLFVGHAETSCFPAAKFEPVDHRGAFGFRRVEPKIAAAVGDHGVKSASVVSPLTSVPAKPKAHKDIRKLSAPPEIPKIKDSFHKARQMADQGWLSEAAAICERLILADRTSADAYCLLGTVQHGLGDLRRAEECFTRAIYLDERCYDAIVQLSLIKEHRGDSEGAEVLRRRAARIQANRESS